MMKPQNQWQTKTFSQSNGGSDQLYICPICGTCCTYASVPMHIGWHGIRQEAEASTEVQSGLDRFSDDLQKAMMDMLTNSDGKIAETSGGRFEIEKHSSEAMNEALKHYEPARWDFDYLNDHEMLKEDGRFIEHRDFVTAMKIKDAEIERLQYAVIRKDNEIAGMKASIKWEGK